MDITCTIGIARVHLDATTGAQIHLCDCGAVVPAPDLALGTDYGYIPAHRPRGG